MTITSLSFSSLQQEYRNAMPASSYQQQKLRVCEVCSAYLGIHDNDRRLADHFGGKLHLGFITIREKLDELKVFYSCSLYIMLRYLHLHSVVSSSFYTHALFIALFFKILFTLLSFDSVCFFVYCSYLYANFVLVLWCNIVFSVCMYGALLIHLFKFEGKRLLNSWVIWINIIVSGIDRPVLFLSPKLPPTDSILCIFGAHTLFCLLVIFILFERPFFYCKNLSFS